ncbi:hypothetical protein [Pseudooceanicola sp.]|uniref:hypothetical protein n=1 Tax=Pseudooceanicola sp. TaxID=1914328 RepID=UPI0040586AB7
MNFRRTIKTGLLVTAALSAAACSTSSTNNTAGNGTPADYATELNRVQNLAPTGDMPKTLNATYTGMTRQDLRETAGGAVVGEMMADLELTADWTEGQAGNPWSGRADNFRGDLNGTDFALTGELTVAEAEARSLTSTIGRTETTVPLPIGGTRTVATGATMINLAGDVDNNGTPTTVLMNLGGAFFGSGGRAITGPASTQGFRAGGVRADLVAAGDYYAEQ